MHTAASSTLGIYESAQPVPRFTIRAQPGCRKVRHRQCRLTVCSIRQPKDPKKYATMDELRTHLTQQQGNGGVSAFLSWMGSTAFGAKRCALAADCSQHAHQHRCSHLALCELLLPLPNGTIPVKYSTDLCLKIYKGARHAVLKAAPAAWQELTEAYCNPPGHEVSQAACLCDLVM